MRRIGRSVSTTAVTAVALAGLVAVAVAASVIEERQDLMDSNGDAMKALAAIAKNEAPFDLAVIHDNAEEIADQLAEAKDMFPEGSHEGDTRAKPEIWEDMAAFEDRLEEAIDAAQQMAQISGEDEFLPALSSLGDGCKGCHERFRRPKDE